MPAFPTAASTPAPSNTFPRTIGTINVNDAINSWSDHPDEAGTVHNTYEQRVLASGQLIRTRLDAIAEVITVNGTWVDGGGLKWVGFRDSLIGVNQVAVDLGHGVKYAMADVVDVQGTYQGAVGRDATTNEILEAWRWSLRIQAYSALRV